MFKKFWNRSRKYKASNSMESMLENGVYQADPKSFFGEFSRQQIVVLASVSDNDRISFETTTPLDGVSYIFAYTSAQALAHTLEMKNLGVQKTAEITGGDLINILLSSNLGMQINAEIYDDPVLCKPENLEYIAEQLNLPKNRK